MRALAPTGLLQNDFRRWYDRHEVARIHVEALNIARRICGDDSDHYKLISTADPDQNLNDSTKILGALKATKNDYEQGFLFNLRSLIEAEVLGDFLSQAEGLIQSGYVSPAASLLGALLEDALRKLSYKHHIEYPEKTKLGSAPN